MTFVANGSSLISPELARRYQGIQITKGTGFEWAVSRGSKSAVISGHCLQFRKPVEFLVRHQTGAHSVAKTFSAAIVMAMSY